MTADRRHDCAYDEDGDCIVCGADVFAGRDYFAQSTTACCPRQTIPDSCSCPDDCECLCTDCICGRADWDEICRCTGICTCEVAP